MTSYTSEVSTPPSSPPWQVDSLSEAVDQRTLCRLCLKQWDWNTARKLACLHVFHEQCLNTKHNNKSKVFNCPVCSTNVAWPENGAREMIKHTSTSCCTNHSDTFFGKHNLIFFYFFLRKINGKLEKLHFLLSVLIQIILFYCFNN